MAYRIFADATADITDPAADGISDVQMIPMQVEICGRNYTYGPGGDLSIVEFYKMQREGNYASTSQINPSVYTEYFEPVLQEGKDVLYLCFSSGLSATFQSAQMAAMELEAKYPGRRVCCVDSLGATAGELLMLRKVVQMHDDGSTLDAVVQWLEENRLKMCHWFVVDTLDHLHHGGRVSAAVAVAGTVLQIKPMLHVTDDGRLENAEKPRGRKKAHAMLLNKLEQGWNPALGNTVEIVHADCIEHATDLGNAIRKRFPEAEIEVRDLGPVIGAHTGPGLLAMIYWGNNR